MASKIVRHRFTSCIEFGFCGSVFCQRPQWNRVFQASEACFGPIPYGPLLYSAWLKASGMRCWPTMSADVGSDIALREGALGYLPLSRRISPSGWCSYGRDPS